MASTDEYRAEFIAGLHALADFLATHPGIPVPLFGTRILVPGDEPGDTEEGRAFIDQAAAALGTPVTDDHDCYKTHRTFGPVDYSIYATSAARRAVHQAEMSYRGCVLPDAAPGATAA
jgi:hypothetical protein